MGRTAKERPFVEVRDRSALRDWLRAHHAQHESVWLVTWKKGTAHYTPFQEFVEELLCWGWIDSQARKVDSERTATLISPRKTKSAWSGVNKGLVAKARASGMMTEFGDAAISAAVKNGMWAFWDDVEALVVPDDLAAALADHHPVWDEWPASIKRAWLAKIKLARADATRAARIAACVEAARTSAPDRGLP